MDLENALIADRSKAQIVRVINYVGADAKRFAKLFTLFLGDNEILAQRSAWAASYCVKAHPELINPYLKPLIKNLRRPDLQIGVKRETVRLIQFIKIPKSFAGTLTNICFGFLQDAGEAIAVRVFSMTVLLKITKQNPGLKNELTAVLESLVPTGGPAIVSRGRKTLKELKKITSPRT